MRLTQTIPADGILRMPVPGRLFLLDDIGTAASVQVELQRGQTTFFNSPGVKRGFRVFADTPFESFLITGAAGSVVSFFVASENVQISTNDDVIIGNPVGNPVNINAVGAVFTGANMGMLSPGAFAGVADVVINAGVSAQVVAADAVSKEREVIVKNLSANAAAFRIGGAASVGAAQGHELSPGDVLILSTLAAVYAFNAGAGAQSLSVSVNTRV